MAPRNARIVRIAQWILAAIVVGFAARELARQWQDIGPALRNLRIDWWLVASSGALVLGTYLVLVEAWRVTLRVWSASLAFRTAARIWFVSNLGKYVPGKVWQIAAMGAMAQREGVPAVAAVGSSLVVNLVNIVSGFAVIAITAGDRVSAAVGGTSGTLSNALVVAIAACGVVALAIAPIVVPRLVRLAARVTGRSLTIPNVPPRAIWIAIAATSASWVLYGIAFALFAKAVSPNATGNAPSYIAVYTGSYLAGYLALFAPGGVGVREAVLVLAMPRFELASAADAAVIAVASRLWLTVLEIVPGVLLLRRPGAARAVRDYSDDS